MYKSMILGKTSCNMVTGSSCLTSNIRGTYNGDSNVVFSLLDRSPTGTNSIKLEALGGGSLMSHVHLKKDIVHVSICGPETSLSVHPSKYSRGNSLINKNMYIYIHIYMAQAGSKMMAFSVGSWYIYISYNSDT